MPRKITKASRSSSGRWSPHKPRATLSIRSKRTSAHAWLYFLMGKIVTLGILIIGLWFLYHIAVASGNPISRVVMRGNQVLQDAEVLRAAPLVRQNVYLASTRATAAAIREVPAVEDVRVVTRLPDVAEIQIKERKPCALWRSEGADFLVDCEGLVLASSRGDAALPIIDSHGYWKVAPGHRVNVDVVRGTMALRDQWPSSLDPRPEVVEVSPVDGISLPSVRGWKVRVGDGEGLAEKLRILTAVLAQTEGSGVKGQVVDLRFKDRPYYR